MTTRTPIGDCFGKRKAVSSACDRPQLTDSYKYARVVFKLKGNEKTCASTFSKNKEDENGRIN